MQHLIVMNYNYTVRSCVHVELDSFRAQLDRLLEGWYRVLGESFVGTAVRDPER